MLKVNSRRFRLDLGKRGPDSSSRGSKNLTWGFWCLLAAEQSSDVGTTTTRRYPVNLRRQRYKEARVSGKTRL
ncbi:hypothetical protein COLO4_28660 [Corchorus olitorius]|uniref:Uncharacterized protein n=1 Tax=Corchorus olitorius TaxID=93759 RepID=A0A1R3HIV2_9ROSI|nr:hypothetical protein COLO4_28660 [Corchorus olitorius]